MKHDILQSGDSTVSSIILAPNLTRPDFRVLRAQLLATRIQPMPDVADTWDEVRASNSRFVLSVGKDALDLWHEWGLVLVGEHHGNTFTPHHTSGVVCMVLQHPGVLLQQSLVGHQAREVMARDLRAFRMMLEGQVEWWTHEMATCGACRRKKGGQRRQAYHWEDQLDHVGLCDDHYGKRASLVRKPKPRLNPSSREAQIPGQLEGMFGDGTKVLTPKG